jgi:hypothetical protein
MIEFFHDNECPSVSELDGHRSEVIGKLIPMFRCRGVAVFYDDGGFVGAGNGNCEDRVGGNQRTIVGIFALNLELRYEILDVLFDI